ncbi:MAG: hypothetical protein HY026_03670 [Deltaproteobacteria bacterium]|nr:hypothetical protein [Deltaproteobacteria bacterium]
MGFFFMSAPISSTISAAIAEALKIEPTKIANTMQETSSRTNQVIRQVSGKFSWGRFIIALLLLVSIFMAGIYTAQTGLEDWSKVLLHSFELVLGLMLGLLGGEAASHR